MNIEKIFKLLGADHLDTQTQKTVNELIKMLIENPQNIRALETLINTIGAGELEQADQNIVRENLMDVINLAARELLSTLSEREKIKKEYTKQPMLVEGDEAINAYHNAIKAHLKVSKDGYKWDRGMHSNPIKETTEKVSKDNWKWTMDHKYAYTPMSGKEYHTNTKGIK